ncbi:MAG: NAD-dependent epimerase/dehydratase family protein [Gemmatimonadaceae bacterium]
MLRTASPHGLVSGEQPTYLITGGTGFLGRHILKSLRRTAPRARLVILARDDASWDKQTWRNEIGDVEVIAGSLFRIEDWKGDPRIAHLGGIFHLAAIVRHSRSDPEEMIRTNVDGALSMVRLAAEKKCRLLFSSTAGTVACSLKNEEGADEDAPFCDDAVGSWPYYASKIRAEREARALAQRLCVEMIVFRPPVLLGPEDHRFRSTAHLLRILRGKLPFILEGEMHFVDVRDAADAMVRAMLHASPKPVYHLVGTRSTLDEFFRMAAKEAGTEAKWRTLPARFLLYLARINEKSGLRFHVIPDPVVIEMASHHWGLASRYAEGDLGYRSRPPQETLRDTIKWMRENNPELRTAD